MVSVVLVPMIFSGGQPPPPAEVSVAAALPDSAVVPDDYAVLPDGVRADVYAGLDGLEAAVAEPTTTTVAPPPPTTETTVEPTTTTTAPPVPTTTTPTPPPPPPPADEVTTTAHTHPEPAPTTTTSTTAPPPPPPPPADDDVHTQEGQASWYELPGARAGVCAHRTIPKGTVVKVTNIDTGKSINCTVDDRGPYAEGKIIDLYRDDFARLAPLAQGVFPARITW